MARRQGRVLKAVLAWTRRDLHSFPHVATMEFYCINYGPGSMRPLYQNEKEPARCELFFCHMGRPVVYADLHCHCQYSMGRISVSNFRPLWIIFLAISAGGVKWKYEEPTHATDRRERHHVYCAHCYYLGCFGRNLSIFKSG